MTEIDEIFDDFERERAEQLSAHKREEERKGTSLAKGRSILETIVLPTLEECKKEVAGRVPMDVEKSFHPQSHVVRAVVRIETRAEPSSKLSFVCDGLSDELTVSEERYYHNEESESSDTIAYADASAANVRDVFVRFLRKVMRP